MVTRTRMMLGLGASLLLPSLTHALTVGRLDVRSSLGEPFYAELVVSDLGSSDANKIQASLAADSDFNQLGLQRNAYGAGLQVSQRMNAQGQLVVTVRSRQPLNDPFLDVVVKIKDGNNTRLQHLTALVDIPKARSTNPRPNLAETSFTALAAIPVQQMPSMPQPRKAAPTLPLQVQDTPLIPIQGEPPELTVAVPEPLLSPAQLEHAPRYTVQRNDSLWRIASKLQASHQQSVGQLMTQIRQLNPTAFVRGDPNQLKQNADLILPPLAAEQDLLTQQPPPDTPKPSAAPLAAKVVKTNPPPQTTSRRGRLPAAEMMLLAPNQAGLAAGNTTHAGRNSGVQPFSRDLLQRVGQTRRHTASLRQEVIELDAQVTANDQKIAMQNTKIAELQQRLKARREAQRLAQSGKTTALPAIAFTALALLSSAMLGIQPVYADAGTTTEAATVATEQTAAAASSGSMTWVFIVIALLVVAAIAAVVLKKKDKPAAPAAKPQARPEAAKPRPVSKAAAPVADAKPVAKTATPAPASQTPAAPVVKTPTPAPVVVQPVVAEQPKDPLVDAQAFISMERYPQAVGILAKAITQQPQRGDLYLALLEIYLLQEDHDAFEELQARLDALEDPIASDQALQLQSRLSPRPVVIDESGEPLTFTKVEIPREQPVEAPIVSSSADDHPLEFSLDKPISDGDSPALELGQDDARAFQLDTPIEAERVESLDSLEAEFKATGTRPSLAALVDDRTTDAPLTDLEFDLSAEDLSTTDDTDHSVLSDALSDLKAFSLEEPATSVKSEQPVDLDFDFEASSFELEDDKASQTTPSGNLAAGFDDLDFSLPDDDQLKPLEEATSLGMHDLSVVAPDHALDDQASQFDALLEQSAGDTPATSDSQRLTSQLAAEFPFLADAEDQATNLELAQRYASLGELSSAHELLNEVLALGSETQKDQARQLKATLAS